MWPHPRQRRLPQGEGLDPGLLLFGVQFADGRKATNLDERMPFRMLEDPDLQPDGPVLSPSRGGGGGGGRWRHGFWVWPLPPEGPLAFVCEWPVAGIPETRTEIDSALVRDAASRSRRALAGRGSRRPGLDGRRVERRQQVVLAPAPNPPAADGEA